MEQRCVNFFVSSIDLNDYLENDRSHSYLRFLLVTMMYGMNSVDVFATLKIHWTHYMSCVTHLCTSGTSHRPLSNDWMVLCLDDAKLSLLQEVATHVTKLDKPPCCLTISVCPWFVLIMMLRNCVDIALFVMSIWF